MARFEIPVRVYVDEIEGLIGEIKCLQTYKLFEGDEMLLVDRNELADIFAKHIRAVKADKDPEQKRGRWIDMDDHLLCSSCGAIYFGIDKNYCPNCGADMRGEWHDKSGSD